MTRSGAAGSARTRAGARGQATGSAHRHSTVARAALAVVAALALLTGCGGASGAGGGAAPAEDGMGHIHALGVDPADGALFIASHHGLFRMAPGSPPERVSAGKDDFMGFAVVGPGHFVGSGHPAPGDDGQPPNLGLIESTDAGRTWHPVSLSGEVDFHSLDVTNGLVVGYDSQTGQIMASTDQKRWDRRATLQIADLAVWPDDPQFVMATTAQGLAHSADGGRTFIMVPSAPVLQVLDWSLGAALVGVDPSGTVGASVDHGATWTTLGSVEGTPTAVITDGPANVHVATDRGVYSSTDGGRTFTLAHSLT